MFISQKTLKSIELRLINLEGMQQLTTKRITSLEKDLNDKIFNMCNINNELYAGKNEVDEIIKKTNIYKKTSDGCSYFDAELTNSSLMRLVSRVDDLEESLKKTPKKKSSTKKVKNASVKRKKS